MAIDSEDPEASRVIAELRRVVQRLSLISHAPTQSYDVVMKGDGVPPTPARWRTSDRREPWPHMGNHAGGKSGGTAAPRGAVDRFGDFQAEYRQKSHVYFEQKLNRIVGYAKSTVKDLEALLAEARQALEDWQKTPEFKGAQPMERGSFQWKCAIADHGNSTLTDQDVREINRLYAMGKVVHRSAIYRYRAQYRGLRGKHVNR